MSTAHANLITEDQLKFGKTSFAGPLVWTLMVGFVIRFLHQSVLPPSFLQTFREKLFTPDHINFIILEIGLFGLFYLATIHVRKLVPLVLAARVENDVVRTASALGIAGPHLRNLLQKRADDERRGYFTERFIRLWNHFAATRDLSAVQRLRDEILEYDSQECQLSFAAVRCAEWAMPLFGFLGTVVGIGQAIGSLQAGISFPDGKLVVNPELVTQSFQGMKTAFETTLAGLVGLLIVGTVHAFLRKRLDQALADTQPIFTKAIENTQGDPPIVSVVEINNLVTELDVLTMEVSALREESREQAEKGAIYRRGVEEMVDAIIDQYPPLEGIRDILYEPVVQFDKAFGELSERLRTFITDKVKQAFRDPKKPTAWTIVASSTAPMGDFCAILVQVNEAASFLCTYSVSNADPPAWFPLKAACDSLLICSATEILLQGAADDQLYWWNCNGKGNPSLKPVLNEDGESVKAAHSLVLPVTLTDGCAGAVLVHDEPTARQIDFLSSNGAAGCRPLVDNPVGHNCRWDLVALAPNGAALALVGQSTKTGEWCLWRYPVQREAAKPRERTQAKQGQDENPLRLGEPVAVNLPGIKKKLCQVAWLSADELILVQEEQDNNQGQLFLFDFSRQTPVRLHDTRWQDVAHPFIRIGQNRWCAVHGGGKLTMWRIRRGGRLQPYSNDKPLQANGFAASGVWPSSMIEGRLLVGTAAQAVAFWTFPEYRVDARGVTGDGQTNPSAV